MGVAGSLAPLADDEHAITVQNKGETMLEASLFILGPLKKGLRPTAAANKTSVHKTMPHWYCRFRGIVF